jgi:hypothetical protein
MAQKAEEVRKQIEKDLAEGTPAPTPESLAEDMAAETTEEGQWSDFARELDSPEEDVIDVLGEETVEEEIPAPSDTPAEETPAEPEVEETVEETPTAEPETPETPETPAEPAAGETPPATPPAPAKTPEELEAERVAAQEARTEERNKALDALSQAYSLSDEEAEKFVTNPEEVVPRFAARLFLDVFDAITSNLHTVLPQVVQNVQLTKEAEAEAEKMFYDANPLLDRAKHKTTVDRYASAYVAVNPNAKAEDILRDVGIQVMYALQIDPTGNTTPPPAAPAKEEVPPAPHVPAGAGAQHTPPASPKGDNVWGDIADELADDET